MTEYLDRKSPFRRALLEARAGRLAAFRRPDTVIAQADGDVGYATDEDFNALLRESFRCELPEDLRV